MISLPSSSGNPVTVCTSFSRYLRRVVRHIKKIGPGGGGSRAIKSSLVLQQGVCTNRLIVWKSRTSYIGRSATRTRAEESPSNQGALSDGDGGTHLTCYIRYFKYVFIPHEKGISRLKHTYTNSTVGVLQQATRGNSNNAKRQLLRQAGATELIFSTLWRYADGDDLVFVATAQVGTPKRTAALPCWVTCDAEADPRAHLRRSLSSSDMASSRAKITD